jgi:transcriptional regulator with PAS, ATPase and Fis domain
MANITPIKFQDNIVGAISVFSDITNITNIATELEKMNLINNLLSHEIETNHEFPDSFKKIIGTSFKLRKQLTFAVKVASIESPVLILGESGTGKELLAQAIHDAGSRKNKPFISINCAAIPDNLLESELFGYEEGAFTGAKKGGKIGKFQQADGGTLFLDEIGDMPLPMQTKLLRFLQEKEINRVGGTKSIKVDIRLISATNKSLTNMVEDKSFREDLFYRINVFTINLPPLRERKIDILNLIENFKNIYEALYKKQVEFSPECIRFLLNYHWPGNIRELKNVIEHLIVMSNDIVTIKKLPEYLKITNKETNQELIVENQIQPLVSKVKDAEKRAFLDALSETNNNRSEAMRILGISRRTFYKKLKEFNL